MNLATHFAEAAIVRIDLFVKKDGSPKMIFSHYLEHLQNGHLKQRELILC